MAVVDYPKLRPIIPTLEQRGGTSYVGLVDAHGIIEEPLYIHQAGFEHLVRKFNGELSLPEIQAEVLRQTRQLISTQQLESLVHQLESRMLLEGPTYSSFLEDFKHAGIRQPALAGRAYSSNPRVLRCQLESYFYNPEGAGLPDSACLGNSTRAVMIPHIDFVRGGPTYTHAYRALIEGNEAKTFIIIGVAHRPCQQRFMLTRKDFETPLGLVRTDRTFVDRIASLVGPSAFEDETAHVREHSIEFQLLFLQHLLGPDAEFSVVPILVGSFDDLFGRGVDPIEVPDIQRFVQALRAAESSSDEVVKYIASVDFGHIGREFGDRDLVDQQTQLRLERFDRAMISHAVAGDPKSWFQTAAAVSNVWRICGLAATYIMLHAAGPLRGELLQYQQAIDSTSTCCVSFASLAFEATDS